MTNTLLFAFTALALLEQRDGKSGSTRAIRAALLEAAEAQGVRRLGGKEEERANGDW